MRGWPQSKTFKVYVSSEEGTILGTCHFIRWYRYRPQQMQRIVEWPTPCSVKQVQQFLGLASYYRRFINRFAEIPQPLHRLTERGRDFKWTKKCHNAFA